MRNVPESLTHVGGPASFGVPWSRHCPGSKRWGNGIPALAGTTVVGVRVVVGGDLTAFAPAVISVGRRVARDDNHSILFGTNMLLRTFAMLVALQQQGQTSTAPAENGRAVERLHVSPANLTVAAGDTLRLEVTALDSEGNPVENASILFRPAGAYFEADVDSTGLVTAGATGTFPVGIAALVPGAKPFIEVVEVHMVAGPAARVEIDAQAAKLVAGQSVRFDASVFSAAGDERDEGVTWKSSAPSVVAVTPEGLVTARSAGRATIEAAAGDASATLPVEVIANTIESVEITPARATARTGDVIDFSVTVRDRRGGAIEGLTPTWTFSPGKGMIGADGSFVGYEAGEYLVSAGLGDASASTVVRLEHRDVRRPLTVVGRLPRTLFTTEEVWVHPGGDYAYLGTGSGGDRMYAIDIRDPSNPTVTDSIVANTRRVNDIMTTPDGEFLVFTREGASDRKNGIVIASLEDPAHPKPIAEFTDGVTAGVHSAFVYRQPKYGTHVYLTNDGTGALHILDISDPYKPVEVAQWRTTNRAEAGRTLHDVDVQDGLAYLSYWNDGLVILDVGNGVAGGSPSNPVLVSQFKYDLDELYREVEATSGPGFIRGTHTAWRDGRYVFIADEVFPASSVKGAKDAAAGRAYGRLQVIDVSDMENPKSVAWYEPGFGGVHNIWIAGDTLYMGAYNGGFHAFDISGELKGDLHAQGREIAHLNTADMDGRVKNTAMTWGVVVKDGLAYVSDMYNGLWIVRIEPKRALVP
ncbi:MAG: Ig-like domain-containing protein [Gemmatimonadaceae bacterium]